jgi:hypothetical protein
MITIIEIINFVFQFVVRNVFIFHYRPKKRLALKVQNLRQQNRLALKVQNLRATACLIKTSILTATYKK